MTKKLLGLASLLALLIAGGFHSSAFAQPPIVIVYGPGGLSIPTLSGVALIALAVCLALLAMRILRGQHRSGANLVVAAMAASAIAAGTGGIDLVAKTWALALTDMTVNEGGEINLPGPGAYTIRNLTDNTQNILDISVPPDCSIGPAFNGGAPGNGGMNGGGGDYQGQCSASPSTSLAPTDYCDIYVSCDEEA